MPLNYLPFEFERRERRQKGTSGTLEAIADDPLEHPIGRDYGTYSAR